MVLNRIAIGAILFIWAVFSDPPSTEAKPVKKANRTIRKYKVLNSDCPVSLYSSSTKDWIETTTSLKKGQTVYGRPSKSDSGLIVFKINPRLKKLYSVQQACAFSEAPPDDLKTVKLRPETPPVAPPTSTEAPADSKQGLELTTPSRHVFYVSAALFSWQERLTLTMPSTNQFTVMENSLGLCLGGGWDYAFRWFYLGASGCAFFASSEAGLRGGTSADGTTYRVKNAMVFGAQAGPSIMFRPFSGNVAIGLVAPLIFRVGNWPDGGQTGGATLNRKVDFFPAPMIETRIERGNFFLAPRVGLYRSLKDIVWSIQGSVRL